MFARAMAHFMISNTATTPHKAGYLFYHALACELARRGHQITFLEAYPPPEYAGPFRYLRWPSHPPRSWRDALFFYRAVRRYRPDCVIGNFSSVNIMMVVGWLTGVPRRVAWYRTMSQALLADGNQHELVRRLRWLRKRIVYAAATHVVANSRASAADAQQAFGVSPQKTLVLYNLVPDPGLDGAPKEACRLISVGRFTPSKNQRVLIEALPQLLARFPDLHVDFYGRGPLKNACEQLAAELGVAEHCTFHGYAPLPVIMPALARAAVCVVTSRSEALGYVGIEAQAVGTPVVASAADGIIEVVADGETGFLVPPDDPAAFADKIGRLLADDELRSSFGRAARQRFLERFSTCNIPAYAEVLEQLVTSRGD